MRNILLDVVIPAAGVGSRMGSSIPKQYLKIQNIEIIAHTISVFLNLPYINNIIVVLSKEDSYFKSLPIASHKKIKLAQGGKERADSVLAGLYQSSTEYVMVHDAARPLLTEHDVNKLVDEAIADDCSGGILCSAVSDTLKLESDGLIAKTVDRSYMFRAFTPQLFKTKDLIKALQDGFLNNALITDEASAMERAGFKVKLVSGRSDNIKITTQDDLFIANALFEYRGRKCE